MNLSRSALAALVAVAVAALTAGCATSTGQADAASQASSEAPNCQQIQADIASTQQAQSESLQRAGDAWRAVVPFVVAARHVNAKSDADEAGRRLDRLRAEFARQGCTDRG